MEFLFMLIASLGGGLIGAAFGANFAFAMVGFVLMAGIGAAVAGDPNMSTTLFSYVAFGPFLGPHVAFAGGVAAAAYAAKKGYLETGRDVGTPLAKLGKVDVLMVGALFGAIGFAIQQGITLIPWFGSHTDSVALAVVLSAMIARLAFGAPSLLNAKKPGTNGLLGVDDANCWLRYQEKPSQFLTLGALAGLFAAGVSIMLATHLPSIGGSANTLAFGVSAITIAFLNMGWSTPVTHHMTNIAGLAAVAFYPIVAGAPTIVAAGWNPGAAVGAILIGAVFGAIAAGLGELFQRLFLSRGNTHIDPPAFAIWVGNTLVAVCLIAVGATA
ncbi:MAG TPA: hypothetical protein VGK17_23405 [Propionicimonas sp.]|jgi:hypothetical protein